MSDYISRENLINDIENNLWDWDTVDGITATTVLKQTITDIKNQPTADVDEVKHERWTWDEKHKEYYCPICQHHKDTEKAYFFPPYCNICGAKMDKKVEE